MHPFIARASQCGDVASGTHQRKHSSDKNEIDDTDHVHPRTQATSSSIKRKRSAVVLPNDRADWPQQEREHNHSEAQAKNQIVHALFPERAVHLLENHKWIIDIDDSAASCIFLELQLGLAIDGAEE